MHAGSDFNTPGAPKPLKLLVFSVFNDLFKNKIKKQLIVIPFLKLFKDHFPLFKM